ncbi:RRQRL motif-containing zinc-binding protein [Streptomyces halstedii]|uniref:RRQRL motif-containing zinc-binding protein n=1 Tax=Streptomyces halstedii TaxID=1944 RepID=UPI000AB7A6EF
MADQDLVDVDPGDGSLPIFRWKQAGRAQLATRRQLRDLGLRPGGQEPVARLECRGGKRFAWLYRIDLAVPKLAMTLAKEAALDKAMAARQTHDRHHRRDDSLHRRRRPARRRPRPADRAGLGPLQELLGSARRSRR